MTRRRILERTIVEQSARKGLRGKAKRAYVNGVLSRTLETQLRHLQHVLDEESTASRAVISDAFDDLVHYVMLWRTQWIAHGQRFALQPKTSAKQARA